MSNPSRQLSGRRLPPLPGNDSLGVWMTRSSCYNIDGTTGLTPEVVKSYLSYAPNVLEEFVLDYVSIDEIENWKTKKARIFNNNYEEKTGSVEASGKGDATSSRYASDDSSKLQKAIFDELWNTNNVLPTVYEIGTIIAKAIRCDGYTFYVVSDGGNTLKLFCPRNRDDSTMKNDNREEIHTEATVPLYTARNQKAVLIKDLLADDRFIGDISCDVVMSHSVLCLPVIFLGGDLIGVLEFTRKVGNSSFVDDDLEYANSTISWIGIAVHQIQANKMLMKQTELNDCLMEISRNIFDDIIIIDNLIRRIMTFAKNLVGASRCSFFLVDEEKQEMCADLFDEGLADNDGQPIYSKKNKIRFSIDRGVAGYVARTGEVLNIKKAYADPRFNRDVDLKTGFTTHNILCMPIISKGTVIGVVQMINKLGGSFFSKADETAFKTFAVYCSLALHYSKIYSVMTRQQVVNKVALEQLSYHIQDTDTEACDKLKKRPFPKRLPETFDTMEFYYKGYEVELPQMFMHMASEIFTPENLNLERMCRFVLTVRKNYRPVTYHNWYHAFTVTHSMYWLMRHIPGAFSKLEEEALFVACICHDLDHRGYNNAYMQKLQKPLAALYSTSVMEQHHFNMTVTILQQENHDIFSHLSMEEYKEVLDNIRNAIIATDLALYFGNQKVVAKHIEDGTLDIASKEQRSCIKAVMMTMCDLSAVCKSWDIEQETVKCIYEEFYAQGDEERRHGLDPLPMMVRANYSDMPNDQVGFVKFVCMPGYKILQHIFPPSKLMLDGCRNNLSNWEHVVQRYESEKEQMWKVKNSRVGDDEQEIDDDDLHAICNL